MNTVSNLADTVPKHPAEMWHEWAARVNLQRAFPAWRIWRATTPEGACGSWVATNRDPVGNGYAPTLIEPTRTGLMLSLGHPVRGGSVSEWHEGCVHRGE